MRRVFAYTALLAFVSPVAADEPLVTDRPDFTESALVVSVGRWQLEGGATWVKNQNGAESVSLGEALLRFGVMQGLELRLALPSWERESWGPVRGQGFGDLDAGVKIQLWRAGESAGLAGADWAAILASTVPTGDEEVSPGVWEPRAIWAAAWQLGHNWSLGANLGVSRPWDDGRRFTSAWVSTSAGYGINYATTAFVELIGMAKERPGGPSTVALQAGLTRQIGPDFQLDVRIARRLTSEGPDLLAGVGAGVRF